MSSPSIRNPFGQSNAASRITPDPVGQRSERELLPVLAAAVGRFVHALNALALLDRPLRPRSLRIGPITWPDDGWDQLGQIKATAMGVPSYLWSAPEWCDRKPRRLLRVVRQLDNASAWVEKRQAGQARHREHIARQRTSPGLAADLVAAALGTLPELGA